MAKEDKPKKKGNCIPFYYYGECKVGAACKYEHIPKASAPAIAPPAVKAKPPKASHNPASPAVEVTVVADLESATEWGRLAGTAKGPQEADTTVVSRRASLKDPVSSHCLGFGCTKLQHPLASEGGSGDSTSSRPDNLCHDPLAGARWRRRSVSSRDRRQSLEAWTQGQQG